MTHSPSGFAPDLGNVPSSNARELLLSLNGEPFLFSHWKRVVFIHFETDAKILQPEVPFELDLRHGKAYVSLVAFHMEKMRPRVGGAISEWLMKPVATHELLNVRTYVRHAGEPGIFFLAEYLPNEISLRLGPMLYGLPYRRGKLNYEHEFEDGRITGAVVSGRGVLSYHSKASKPAAFQPTLRETLDEFLLERYTAFTHRDGVNRFFRIWHPPWNCVPVQIDITENSLLAGSGEWFHHARCVGSHYSHGFENI
ncbi:MAG: DUF2071 domain-containing protein, partial [Verrucomicrobiota bacterium]